MKPKKNPKADLSRRSVLFLQLGLILVLLITWQAIEWKTYDKKPIDTGQLNMDEIQEEEIPITQMQNTPPPPPPPPPAPEVIEVVEDEEEVEEDVIESTETDQEEIVEVEEVVEASGEEEVVEDVPFSVIEDVPIYPGCEGLNDNEARKKCMSEKITQFVQRNFDTGIGSEVGLSGVNRVIVQFKIDATGKIVDVKSRAPHPRLEREAVRVINQLPMMQPGKQRGKAVGVMYSLPIVFQVQD